MVRDNGEDNVAASLRVFWPAPRDSLAAGRSLDWTLEYVRLNAWRLGPQARELEERSVRRMSAQSLAWSSSGGRPRAPQRSWACPPTPSR
jgi:hypothetical protein